MPDEYQQVAALLAMDIELMSKVAENKSHDADFLRGYIEMIKQKKDDLINDPKVRETRFNATCRTFSIPKEQDNDSRSDS